MQDSTTPTWSDQTLTGYLGDREITGTAGELAKLDFPEGACIVKISASLLNKLIELAEKKQVKSS